MTTYPDILALAEAYATNGQEARAVAAGLPPRLGAWRSQPGSWSVAECLDHLATANRVYLAAMEPAAAGALADGRMRRGPAIPGVVGRLFVRMLEPPARPGLRSTAPRAIRPRTAPSLEDAMEAFLASQVEVQRFLVRYAEIDLAGVRFPNPFISGVRFSLATGLHVIAAHERRHLWQAGRVRRAAEGARDIAA